MSKQLVQPNLTVSGQLGWCLQYADRVFGVGAGFPTAWDGWKQTDFPHADRNVPQDVAVPLWFDYWESGIRYGHVVVSVPGKGLYSSPWKAGQTHAVLSSIAEVERIYGVTYVGWSEDISNVRVAQIGEDMFNEGDRINWLEEAHIKDEGQYKDLVNKVTYKEAVEKMRTDKFLRANQGDITNEFEAFGLTASKEDIASWTGAQHKRVLYDKWMKQNLVQGGSDYVDVGEVSGDRVFKKKEE